MTLLTLCYEVWRQWPISQSLKFLRLERPLAVQPQPTPNRQDKSDTDLLSSKRTDLFQAYYQHPCALDLLWLFYSLFLLLSSLLPPMWFQWVFLWDKIIMKFLPIAIKELYRTSWHGHWLISALQLPHYVTQINYGWKKACKDAQRRRHVSKPTACHTIRRWGRESEIKRGDVKETWIESLCGIFIIPPWLPFLFFKKDCQENQEQNVFCFLILLMQRTYQCLLISSTPATLTWKRADRNSWPYLWCWSLCRCDAQTLAFTKEGFLHATPIKTVIF